MESDFFYDPYKRSAKFIICGSREIHRELYRGYKYLFNGRILKEYDEVIVYFGYEYWKRNKLINEIKTRFKLEYSGFVGYGQAIKVLTIKF
jgi:hypothetical protein